MDKNIYRHDAQRKWDADANLRAEFDGDFEAFAAWYESDQKGLIKTLGRQK